MGEERGETESDREPQGRREGKRPEEEKDKPELISNNS